MYQQVVKEKRDKVQGRKDQLALMREANRELLIAIREAAQAMKNPAVIPTDKLDESVQKFTDKLDSIDITQTVDISDDIKDAIESLKSSNSADVTAFAKRIETALAKIKLPTPNVTVEQQTVDLTPLTDAIKELKTEPTEAIELNEFRAHDLEDRDNLQYVGFVAPDGRWYIIENLVKENKMRYSYGNENYSDAWGKRGRYKYTTLSEAINAPKA